MKKQQEEQQQVIQQQQEQITHLQDELNASKKAIEEQRLFMEAMEKRFEDMITRRTRLVQYLYSCHLYSFFPPSSIYMKCYHQHFFWLIFLFSLSQVARLNFSEDNAAADDDQQ